MIVRTVVSDSKGRAQLWLLPGVCSDKSAIAGKDLPSPEHPESFQEMIPHRNPQLYLKKSTEMSRSSSRTTANLASCRARRTSEGWRGTGQSTDTSSVLCLCGSLPWRTDPSSCGTGSTNARGRVCCSSLTHREQVEGCSQTGFVVLQEKTIITCISINWCRSGAKPASLKCYPRSLEIIASGFGKLSHLGNSGIFNADGSVLYS